VAHTPLCRYHPAPRAPDVLKRDHARLEQIPGELEKLYDRWEELAEHKG
jgi:hypothetical protein